MKRSLLIILLSILVPFTSMGQKGFKIGMLAGPTFAVAQTPSLTSIPGFSILPHFGAMAGIHLHYGIDVGYQTNIAMQLGANISYTGFRFRIDNDYIKLQQSIEVSPFEFPLALSIRSKVAKSLYLKEFVAISVDLPNRLTGNIRGTVPSEDNGPIPYEIISFVPDGFIPTISVGLLFEKEVRNQRLLNYGLVYHYRTIALMTTNISYIEGVQQHVMTVSSKGNYLSFQVTYFFDFREVCPVFY
ncbi:MAG: hypothetical protein IIA45_13625 [Bacteroidetes bacterium]|nr:hypothetical protein [Bacteroidota bacterium]